MAKRKKKKEDPFIYVLILSLLVVLSLVLSFYKVYSVSFGTLIVPLIIYITNYIYNNYDYKETLNSCLISILMVVLYLFLLYNLEDRIINILEVLKYLIIYSIVAFFPLIINKYKKNTSKFITCISYSIIVIIYLIFEIIF